MTKHADPANHLHLVRSAMPKPGQLLTPVATLHSVKPISKPRKADKAMIAPTDAFGPEAMRRRAEDERIAAVDFATAPITNATVRAPLVAPRNASLRPGAEDYSKHPSLVGTTRVTYAARCGDSCCAQAKCSAP